MASERGAELTRLLDYGEDTAGGIMTTALAIAGLTDTADEVRARLRQLTVHRGEIDAIVVLDEDGYLVDDLPLFDLALAEPAATMNDLTGEEVPVTVAPDDSVHHVAGQLIESRRSSVLVVADDRPVGRILADDVVDALLPERGRLHFPRFLQ